MTIVKEEPYVPSGVQAQLDRSKTMDRILSFSNMHNEEMYVYVGFYRYKEEIFICIHNKTNLSQHDASFYALLTEFKDSMARPQSEAILLYYFC